MTVKAIISHHTLKKWSSSLSAIMLDDDNGQPHCATAVNRDFVDHVQAGGAATVIIAAHTLRLG